MSTAFNRLPLSWSNNVGYYNQVLQCQVHCSRVSTDFWWIKLQVPKTFLDFFVYTISKQVWNFSYSFCVASSRFSAIISKMLPPNETKLTQVTCSFIDLHLWIFKTIERFNKTQNTLPAIDVQFAFGTKKQDLFGTQKSYSVPYTC